MTKIIIGLVVVLIGALGVTAWQSSSPGHKSIISGLPGMPAVPSTPSTFKPSGKPNIVFVLTDDLDFDLVKKLPKLKDTMTAQGMTFDNNYVSLSLCCPSRSSILCGEYAHNTGVFTNGKSGDILNGGYKAFMAAGDDKKTVAIDLQKAGYKTAIYGKYLNGYEVADAGFSIPPGWSDFAVPNNGIPYSEYNYSLNVNGKPEDHYLANCDPTHTKQCHKKQYDNSTENKDANYMTHVLNTKADNFITASAQSSSPFFVYLASYAPHGPSTPAAEYEHLINGTSDADKQWRNDNKAPRNPAFNEADLSDKPSWMQAVPLLSDKEIKVLDKKYQLRLASLYSVDDMLVNLVDTLKKTGQLDNTYVVFTSDNGFHLGEHRLTAGKLTEFDTDLHTPLVIRGPGIAKGVSTNALTGNIDFSPTFLELIGAPVNPNFDGHSFASLLTNPTLVWRNSYLLEHGPSPVKDKVDANPTNEPSDNNGATATDVPIKGANKGANLVDSYEGVRTTQYTYIHYTNNNEEELYDDVKDPYQLSNIIKTADTSLIAKLRARTTALSTCKGAQCATFENQTI